ncbi:AP-4 complex subunit mu-1-like [Ornithodoros turicata]|uniref:AP-4 complex subunit mu-1-like n=1 Tax=Ornithodoros turicata TaxID=34597 RepID=UPI003139DB8E
MYAMFYYLGIATSNQDVIIYRQYRNDDKIADFKSFVAAATKKASHGGTPSVAFGNGVCYFISREKLLYLLCSDEDNGDSGNHVSTAVAIEFLEEFYHLIKAFCGTASEEGIRLNLLLVEEIMAEILNQGHIVTTELSSLRPLIYSEPIQPNRSEGILSSLGLVPQTMVIIWSESKASAASVRPVFSTRQPQREKQKGEVYVDVVERISATVLKDGRVSNFELCGSLMLRCCLDSHVDIMLGLNENLILRDKPQAEASYTTDLELDSYVLHRSVKYQDSDSQRTLMVRAPQGEVPLMKYLITRVPQNGLPFIVTTEIASISNSKDLNLTARLRCEGIPGSEAVNVVVRIVVPSRITAVMKKFAQPNQTAELKNQRIVWKIPKLTAKSETVARFRLVEANHGEGSKVGIGPLVVEFELSNHCTSGLHIRFLKLSPNLPSHRWVRYITTSASMVFLLS